MTLTREATRRPRRTAGRLATGLLAVLLIVAAQSVDAVDAAAPKWSQPVAVSHSGDGWFPDVAADSLGNVHVVWQAAFGDAPPDESGAPNDTAAGAEPPSRLTSRDVSALYYTRLDRSGWSKPTDIALIWHAHALRSSLTADRSGRVHLVYKGFGKPVLDETTLKNSLGPEDLWYTTAKGDQASSVRGWLPATRITHGTTGYYSDLAIDSRGVIHVIWTESDRRGWGLYYAHSSDGGATFSKRVALDAGDFVWWYRATLTVDGRDRLHVVWERTDQKHLGVTRQAVYSQSSDGGQSWSQSVFEPGAMTGVDPASVTFGAGPQQPSVGVDGSGTVLLVTRDPISSQISYRSSRDGLAWSGPTALPGVKAGVARPYDVYSMVTDSAGHVHLAVVGYPNDSETISLLTLEWDGQRWSEPSVVAGSPPFPEYPRLALSDGNQLHLVWFVGDRATIDRVPQGIWYSTASTGSPRAAGELTAPPARQPPTPVREAPLVVGDTVPAPVAAGKWAESTISRDQPAWLVALQGSASYPIVVGLAAVGVVIASVAAARAALSLTRGA